MLQTPAAVLALQPVLKSLLLPISIQGLAAGRELEPYIILAERALTPGPQPSAQSTTARPGGPRDGSLVRSSKR